MDYLAVTVMWKCDNGVWSKQGVNMRNAKSIPPACCVIIEMEPGASLGYRRAVLLNEIEALGSLNKAAKTTAIPFHHAMELVQQMNNEFSRPLVKFVNSSVADKDVVLSNKGKEIAKSYWRQFGPVWNDILQERSRHY